MRKLSSKAAFLSGAICLCTFSLLSGADGLIVFSSMRSLSAFQPKADLNVILGLIAILAVLVGTVVALASRKHVKIVVASVLTIVVVVASIGAVWYAEASISYWFVSADTTGAQDNALTMYCENIGHLQGTFDLVLSFTNAHLSLKTSLPYQLVDNQTAKFTFALQPGEKQSRQAWFIINDNVSDFYIALSFQQNDGNFLVKSGPGGVDFVSYQRDVADRNFTKRIYFPPP